MVRRRAVEEHENHERWVISYADFITLLFAFFVVMYSISSVNEGKYKVLSDSLVAVFNASPKTLSPVNVGSNDVYKSNDQLIKLPEPGDYPSKEDYKFSIEGVFDDVETKAVKQGEMKDNEVSYLTKTSEQLAMTLQKQMANDEVEIRGNEEWLEVNIKASVLYSSGSAELADSALPILKKIGDVLANKPNTIQVEGYTDNVPIQTAKFPSNWELSAARAASVVRYFELLDIDASRMAAVGYAEHHPVASNDTEDGRLKNRRISLVISKAESDQESNIDGLGSYKLGEELGNTGVSVGSRQRREVAPKVPLKIIRLQDGGLLFSSETKQ